MPKTFESFWIDGSSTPKVQWKLYFHQQANLVDRISPGYYLLLVALEYLRRGTSKSLEPLMGTRASILGEK
ncbi:hypothetical protein GCM10007338_12760 [Corynebacterium pelargi]|nr:hypothetical protein GCM10007338_12760 [Corynebacterium pelargi]